MNSIGGTCSSTGFPLIAAIGINDSSYDSDSVVKLENSFSGV